MRKMYKLNSNQSFLIEIFFKSFFDEKKLKTVKTHKIEKNNS